MNGGEGGGILPYFTGWNNADFSKSSSTRQNDISTRFDFMPRIKYCEGKDNHVEGKSA